MTKSDQSIGLGRQDDMRENEFDDIQTKLYHGGLTWQQKVDNYVLAKALIYGKDKIRREDKIKLIKLQNAYTQ